MDSQDLRFGQLFESRVSFFLRLPKFGCLSRDIKMYQKILKLPVMVE